MCVRYVSIDGPTARLEDLRDRYRDIPTHDRFPGDQGSFVREGGELVEGLWGLQPFWAGQKSPHWGRTHAYNARAETVAEKPTFRSAFRQRRAVLPAAAFYERAEGRWLRIRPKEGPFLIAALWEPENETTGGLPTYTMVTTEPNAFVADVHDRMPVILTLEDADGWMDPKADLRGLHALLVPSPPEGMAVEDAGPMGRPKRTAPAEPGLF